MLLQQLCLVSAKVKNQAFRLSWEFHFAFPTIFHESWQNFKIGFRTTLTNNFLEAMWFWVTYQQGPCEDWGELPNKAPWEKKVWGPKSRNVQSNTNKGLAKPAHCCIVIPKAMRRPSITNRVSANPLRIFVCYTNHTGYPSPHAILVSTISPTKHKSICDFIFSQSFSEFLWRLKPTG